jgi:hypothetical protein
MKYATAIALGGEVIKPEQCNYESYKKLGLICPFCKNGVYVVAETTRDAHQRILKSGKIVKVPMQIVSGHFAHFVGVSEQCEVRSKKIRSEQLQQWNNKSKQQREKIMQRKLWSMLCTSPLFSESRKVENRIPNPYHTSMSAILDVLVSYLLAGLLHVETNELSHSMEDYLTEHFEDLASNPLTSVEDTNSFIAILNSNKTLHSQIVVEVILFLRGARQRNLFRDYCTTCTLLTLTIITIKGAEVTYIHAQGVNTDIDPIEVLVDNIEQLVSIKKSNDSKMVESVGKALSLFFEHVFFISVASVHWVELFSKELSSTST